MAGKPLAPSRLQPSRARYYFLSVGLAGEFFMGGLIFGWNALSVMLKGEGVFAAGCDQDSDSCSRQDSKLNTVWTAGVFAVNFGLAFAGASLDYIGPKFTSSAGAAMTSAGLIALGFGVTAPSILPAGAFMIGLGGLCFHMSQFHTAQLFPENKGLISSLYVGFFIASGVTFELLREVYASIVPDEGPDHDTYRAILVGHAALCLPWAVLMLWMNPRHTLKAGQTYHFHPKQLQFAVSTDDSGRQTQGADQDSVSREPVPSVLTATTSCGVESKAHSDDAVAVFSPADNAIRPGGGRVCNTPMYVQRPPPEAKSEPKLEVSEVDVSTHEPAIPISDTDSFGCLDREDCSNPGHDRSSTNDASDDRSFRHSIYSSVKVKKNCYQLRRRWSMLASKPVLQQLRTPECVSLGLIFTGNVYALQLYLGTARIQLEEMGDNNQVYLQMLSFMVPGIFVFAPFNGYCLDRLGFGIVLLAINVMSLAAAVLQSIPVLELQVVNFLIWSMTRYSLYSTFFTAIGTLFSYQSFGRITAVISVCQSLIGLTQLPLTDFAIVTLEKDFTYLQIGAIVLVTCLFIPVVLMYRWERRG